MKHLLLLSLSLIACVATSCRTVTPMDPMTMKQSQDCLPGHFTSNMTCCAGRVEGTK